MQGGREPVRAAVEMQYRAAGAFQRAAVEGVAVLCGQSQFEAAFGRLIHDAARQGPVDSPVRHSQAPRCLVDCEIRSARAPLHRKGRNADVQSPPVERFRQGPGDVGVHDRGNAAGPPRQTRHVGQQCKRIATEVCVGVDVDRVAADETPHAQEFDGRVAALAEARLITAALIERCRERQAAGRRGFQAVDGHRKRSCADLGVAAAEEADVRGSQGKVLDVQMIHGQGRDLPGVRRPGRRRGRGRRPADLECLDFHRVEASATDAGKGIADGRIVRDKLECIVCQRQPAQFDAM